jgi:hypothetical protein
MKYTLITRNGKVFVFNVLACAETFQQAYGGELITDKFYFEIYAEFLTEKETQNETFA